jgi:hypothetical protein
MCINALRRWPGKPAPGSFHRDCKWLAKFSFLNQSFIFIEIPITRHKHSAKIPIPKARYTIQQDLIKVGILPPAHHESVESDDGPRIAAALNAVFPVIAAILIMAAPDCHGREILVTAIRQTHGLVRGAGDVPVIRVRALLVDITLAPFGVPDDNGMKPSPPMPTGSPTPSNRCASGTSA